MPTDHHKGDKSDASKYSIFDGQTNISDLKPSYTGEKKKRRNSGANNETGTDKPNIVEIVSIPKIDNSELIEANRIAKKANNISVWSAIVSGLLFIITVVLALVAISQYHSAQSAATIAQKTFEETRGYDSINLSNAQIQSKKNDSAEKEKFKRDTATSNLQRKSLNTQIASIKETQKYFAISNEPYLQIKEATISNPTIGSHYMIKFTIENLGNYPVKIINMTKYSAIRPDNPGIKNIKMINDADNFVGRYIIKDNPQQFIHDDYKHTVTIENTKIIQGRGYYWNGGVITYENLINHKTKMYTFLMRIKFDGWNSFIYNDNRYVK
ncbi:MAG TPA: hypothetical protein VIJ27_05350 [Mucilaginibacter sp.]